MLDRTLAFSLKNSTLVALLSLLVMALAWHAVASTPVDVFPELNAPTVVIMTESGGLAADEVEQYISFPLESAVNGVPGLRRVRSSSALGLSIVWVEFDWGVDLYRARQLVGERLDTVRDDLPVDAHAQMAPISSITGEVMLLSLTAAEPEVSGMDVRAYAEFDLRNRLLTVPGVSQVVAIGGALPEYQVLLRQERLQLYDLTSQDVADALADAHNTNTAGFLVDVEGLELPMRQTGRVRDIDDVARTVVAYRGGAPVTVAQIAEVRLGGAFRRGAAGEGGKEAVVLSVQKAPGTNTLAITRDVDSLLNQIEPNLEAERGIHLNRHVFRQAAFIQRSIDNVTKTLLEAVIIVAVVLLLFLGNVRTALITLTALPVSLGTTLVAMWALGMTINVMTLGGLAVAVGVLVDDAIVGVENVYRRLGENAELSPERQRPRLRVIFAALHEVASVVIFTTVILAVVFVPLMFMQGLEGRFFRPLGLTYIISVFVSTAVALTLTPALCVLLLRGKVAQAHGEGRLVRAIKWGYRPILSLVVRFRMAVIVGAAVLLGLSLWLASTFGTSFLPRFNEGVYTVFLNTPAGTSLVESERIGSGVERRLLEVPGVDHVVRRTGRAERDEHAEPPSANEIEVGMDPDADPEQVLAAIDAVLADLPGVNASIGQPIGHRLSMVMSGTKAELAIGIFGEDLPTLRQVAERVEGLVAEVPGTRDVRTGLEVLVTTLPIRYRLDDLERWGLTAAEAGRQVKRALYGQTVATINQREGQDLRRYDLVLRLEETRRDSIADVRDLVLTGADGALVRLDEVADIGLERASNLITRENARRKTVVSCNVADGHNLGDLVARVRTVVDPVAQEAGCTVHYGGTFEAQQSAARTLLVFGGIALALMVLLLEMAVGSFRPAVLVMANLPLALVGGVAAIFIAASPDLVANSLALFGAGVYRAPVISIASMVGFITLFGIAVRNGMLLVNHFKWLILHGATIEEAVRRGSEERLVPVLMTALTTALGLIPLALRLGEPGSELLAPLAIVVLGGLVSSTLLNMLVVPAGYLLFCRGAVREEEHEEHDLSKPTASFGRAASAHDLAEPT